jgi:hypothetical protein
MTEAQGRVARYGALPFQDFRDAVCWHFELTGQFGRAHVQFFKLFGEMFAWMYGTASHDAPQW